MTIDAFRWILKKNHRYYLCHRKKNLAFIKYVVELQGKPLRHGGLEIKSPTSELLTRRG